MEMLKKLLSGVPCLSSAEFLSFKNTLNLPETKWDMKNQFQLQVCEVVSQQQEYLKATKISIP